MQKGDEISGTSNIAGAVEEHSIDSPLICTVPPPPVTEEVPVIKADGEDVKMEEG